MSTTPQLYQHLIEKFSSYSIEELIYLNNETVKDRAFGSTKAAFRTAIIATFSRKGLDISHIISREDGFTTINPVPVRLEHNILIPTKE